MKSYSLKILGNNSDFITILNQQETGYVIKIVRNIDGFTTESTDFLSKEVFDTCIKTGYLTEIKEPVMAYSA